MKVKVVEATRIQIDWMVAKCWYTDRRVETGVMGATFGVELQPGSGDRYSGWMQFSPSTNWAQGGPIIEREGISVSHCKHGVEGVDAWWATGGPTGEEETLGLFGPTPLIAAMRCFVASKLGDEVEVPEELV